VTDGDALLGERARLDVLSRNGVKARAEAIVDRLGAIRAQGLAPRVERSAATPRSREQPAVGFPARPALAQLASSPVVLGARSRPVRLVQRALLRLLRPLTLHVRQLGIANLDALVETDQRLTAAFNSLAAEYAALREELQTAPYMSRPELLRTRDPHGRVVLGYTKQDARHTGKTYFEFEEMFRGPEDLIRERQRPYVSVLSGHGPVVDIGCGRGELLDLLAEAHAEVTGVDLDPDMVERCRSKGHDVVRDDALRYLGARPDGSIGAIFSAQFIEHISYEDLLAFLELGLRKLRPGGVFVAETVNPHSIQAFKAFWVDLTHQKPIFPETLLALCRATGFAEATVLYPAGEGVPERDRTRAGEYAVVARKE